MLAVRPCPGLVTPALWAWLRPYVRDDDDGGGCLWLEMSGGKQTATLPLLLDRVARAVAPDAIFSGVLLQAYRDGRAVTPCHTDASGTGFGFILSLGAARTFRVHPTTAACEDDRGAVAVECVEGTVLVMDEAFQAGWHHRIAPDPDVTGEKLSLVFRTRPGGSG